MIKELGKTIVAGLLVGSLAMPVPAAESAAITTAKSSVKSHSRKRLAPSRYRGYAPTYADSISADDPAYDDPIVRQAVVDCAWPLQRFRCRRGPEYGTHFLLL